MTLSLKGVLVSNGGIDRNRQLSGCKYAMVRICKCLAVQWMPSWKSYQVKGRIIMTKQVKSRQRVADHGEVFTAERKVNAMLDLVKQETERVDSRFIREYQRLLEDNPI